MMAHQHNRTSQHQGSASPCLATRHLTVFCLLPSAFCLLLLGCSIAEAAVSKGTDKQLETGSANQGGGTSSSSTLRQQATLGEPFAAGTLKSSKFGVSPGFIAASLAKRGPAKSELDISVLYARTAPLGQAITPSTWVKDSDPIFYWDPPAAGPDLAGYSYAVDATPDTTVDTTATSFDVATSALKTLADGIHTFSVQAVNSAGNAGKPITFEIWVDVGPPTLASYTPGAGVLLSTASPTVQLAVSDAGSGLSLTASAVLINGRSTSLSLDAATGILTAGGGGWEEGTNSLEARLVDAIGNAQAPVLWSVAVDTVSPTGTVTINGGSAMTTSVYVTLGLVATDKTSGVARMLVSNDRLSGYVEEPFATLRELWKLTPLRGVRSVYVKFIDKAGNVADPVSDEIELGLLSPETTITSGPAGFLADRDATFIFMCPEGECLFAWAFDNDEWSDWNTAATAAKAGLTFGNHYFRVKAAKDVNGLTGIQPDEEDPSPAERTWIVGVEPSMLTPPKGPPVKVWRLE